MTASRTPHTVPTQAPGLRRVALALHATQAPDRQWLLEQIPLDQRAEVQRMLAELTQLGWPREAQLVQDALRNRKGAQPPRQPARASTPGTAPDLNRAQTRHLALLLESEPAVLGAQVLCQQSPTRRQQLLAILSQPKRRAVEHQLKRIARHASPCAQSAPALTEALRQEIAHRLATPTPTRPKLVSMLASWLTRQGAPTHGPTHGN